MTEFLVGGMVFKAFGQSEVRFPAYKTGFGESESLGAQVLHIASQNPRTERLPTRTMRVVLLFYLLLIQRNGCILRYWANGQIDVTPFLRWATSRDC